MTIYMVYNIILFTCIYFDYIYIWKNSLFSLFMNRKIALFEILKVQETGSQSSAVIGHFHQFSCLLSSISSKVTLHLCFWNIPWVPSERCCSSVISVALFHIHSSAMLPWSPKVLSTPPASVCDTESVCALYMCVFSSLILLFLCNVLITLHHAVLSTVSSLCFVKPREVIYNWFFLIISILCFSYKCSCFTFPTHLGFSCSSVLPRVTSQAQFREHLKLEQPHTAQTRYKKIDIAVPKKCLFTANMERSFESDIFEMHIAQFWVVIVSEHSFSGKLPS